MTEDIFNLILKIATYDGDTEYRNYEELVNDFENAGSMALVPPEVKRIAYTAYTLGFENGKKTEEEN